MNFLRHQPIPRRTALRGLLGGSTMITVGLPVLDAMLPKKASAQTFPKRFVGFLKPNGMSAYRADAFGNPSADNWTPKQTGANYSYPTAGNLWQSFIDKNLKPITTVISGVHNEIAGGLAHDAQTSLLTPYRHVSAGNEMYMNKGGGRSLDQIIADKIGTTTRFRSLEFSVAQSSNTVAPMCVFWSYTAAGQENPPEQHPYKMWMKLFSQGVSGGQADPAALERLKRQRKSVLDVVATNIATMEKRLGSADKQRLDQHLSSVRAVEQSVTNITVAPSTCTAPAMTPFIAQNGTNIPMLMSAQQDLLVMALVCDLARVATIVLGGGQSDAVYPFLGLGTTMFVDSHHALTHGGSKAATDKIDQWQMGAIADLITKLKNVQEGGSTLLDSTAFMAGSDSASGWHHNEGGTTWNSEVLGKGSPRDHAFILAGATHYFKHGAHVRFRSGQQTHVPLLDSLHEAVCGEPPPSSWGNPSYRKGTMPGLKGDTSSRMW